MPAVRAARAEFALCIEGGGTKSRGVLYASDSEEPLGRAASGLCNPSNSFADSMASVNDLWSQIGVAAGLECGRVRLCLGIAGIVPADVRVRFIASFTGFADVLALSDGYAALIGAGRGRPCGMVVAGTGCAGHRLRADGFSLQRDGWGWIGGDRGSGLWIGLRAIRHALAVRDGVARGGMLAAKVNGMLGHDDAEAASWLVSSDPCSLARYATAAFACAAEGDEFANGLLDRAAAHLRSLLVSLGCAAGEQLYVSGSIGNALFDRIGAGLGVTLQRSEADALEGCRMVAQGGVPLEWPGEARLKKRGAKSQPAALS